MYIYNISSGMYQINLLGVLSPLMESLEPEVLEGHEELSVPRDCFVPSPTVFRLLSLVDLYTVPCLCACHTIIQCHDLYTSVQS